MRLTNTVLAEKRRFVRDGIQAMAPTPHLALAPDDSRQSREIVAHIKASDFYIDYERAFRGTTGLPLALRSVGSFHSPLVDAKGANPFCRLMAGTNESCAACLCLQQQLEDVRIGEARTLDCFAGLSESVVPIHVGDRVVAFLQTGQVLLRRPTALHFERCIRELAKVGAVFERATLEEAYYSTPVVPRSRYDSMLRLLILIAEHLSFMTNQLMVQQAGMELPAVKRARAYIAEHQTGEISLSDVAASVHMSPFYFCKTFRKETGVTYIDYLARLRIESVKIHLLNPHKRISEAAYEAGFQSLSQFNRVFLRVVGMRPTAYRMQCEAAGCRA